MSFSDLLCTFWRGRKLSTVMLCVAHIWWDLISMQRSIIIHSNLFLLLKKKKKLDVTLFSKNWIVNNGKVFPTFSNFLWDIFLFFCYSSSIKTSSTHLPKDRRLSSPVRALFPNTKKISQLNVIGWVIIDMIDNSPVSSRIFVPSFAWIVSLD